MSFCKRRLLAASNKARSSILVQTDNRSDFQFRNSATVLTELDTRYIIKSALVLGEALKAAVEVQPRVTKGCGSIVSKRILII